MRHKRGFIRRLLRGREPPIDRLLVRVTTNIENLAEQIFLHVIATDQKMPPREKVESAMKGFLTEFLAPAREQAIKAGKPEAEVEAYVSVVTSHAQVAFQTKWAELEFRRVESAPEALTDSIH